MKNYKATKEVRDWDKLDSLDAAHAARDAAFDAWDSARNARDAARDAYNAICIVTNAAESNAFYHKYIVDRATRD